MQITALDANKLRIPHAEQGQNWDMASSNSCQSSSSVFGLKAIRTFMDIEQKNLFAINILIGKYTCLCIAVK
jgi:hypothetical protein